MALILPNDLANEQEADGDKLQQNFLTIETWANQEAISRDGSTAMTGALLLPGPPTQPNQAASKDYVDQAGGFISEMRMYGGDTAPNANWLLCQGQAISRTTYAALFAVVGIRYGAGDGSTTFNLPDMRGQYGCGAGAAYGTAVGAKFGTKDAVLPTHSHTGPSHTHLGADHLHGPGTLSTAGQTASHHHLDGFGGVSLLASADHGNGTYVGVAGGGLAPLYFAGTGPASNDHYHAVTGGATGPADRSLTTAAAGTGATSTVGADPVNGNLPPSVSVNFIMKVA